jgi:hypothetical protein
MHLVFAVILAAWLASLWWSYRIVRHIYTSVGLRVALTLGLSLTLWLGIVVEWVEAIVAAVRKFLFDRRERRATANPNKDFPFGGCQC